MKKLKILAVIVNYGEEQLSYLKQMVVSLKNFKNYEVSIIVNSNITFNIKGVDKVELFELEDNRNLPLTCRKTIWENRDNYDLFFYSENDLSIKEDHFDRFLIYTNILPKNRIAGLIRYEEDQGKKVYPDYHAEFDWDYKSVEKYGDKTFSHFTNLHQASFILTKDQLMRVGRRFKFWSLVKDKIPLTYRVKEKVRHWLSLKTKKYYIYDVICKVCTDIYKHGGMKKVICISEFEDSLIHHMSDVYANGLKGKNMSIAHDELMTMALKKMNQGSQRR